MEVEDEPALLEHIGRDKWASSRTTAGWRPCVRYPSSKVASNIRFASRP